MERKYLSVKEYILILLTCDLLPTLKASITSGYIGCFSTDTITELTHIKPDPRPISGEICKQLCVNRSIDYRYAATKNGKQCHCGTAFGEHYTHTGCDKECTGNTAELCGGKDHISLYDTWKCATFPCMHNATCDDIDGNNYTCTCTDGFSGDSCEQPTETSQAATTTTLIITTSTTIPDSISSLSYRLTSASSPSSNTSEETSLKISRTTTIGSVVTGNSSGINEENSVIAVYVAVPMTVIIAFGVVSVCVIWRKRKAKYGSEAGCQGSESVDDSRPVSAITNAAYTAHKMNHTADTANNGDMSGLVNDYYTEIPLDNIQDTSDVPSNEYNTIELGTIEYNVPENSYGHLINGKAPFVNIAYSHMDKYPVESKSGTMDTTYSHIGTGQIEATLKQTAVDVNDTYSVLQTMSHSEENKEMRQREFDKERVSVYDHAFAGSQNKTIDDTDEYAHLNGNMNTEKSHMQREDQHIVLFKDNSICNDDLVDRNQNGGYEQEVCLTPHYFVLESEDQLLEDNANSGIEQDVSHVDETEYDGSSKHEYFVLEKTDTKE